jgi:hypothetical protein
MALNPLGPKNNIQIPHQAQGVDPVTWDTASLDAVFAEDSFVTNLSQGTDTNPLSWFQELKEELGEFSASGAMILKEQFSYEAEPNKALENTDQFLEYLAEIFNTEIPFQTYSNPNSKTYAEIQKQIQTEVSEKGLEITYESDSDKFRMSKKVALLIANDHTSKETKRKTAELYFSLFSDPTLALSSSFAEGHTESNGVDYEINKADIPALAQRGTAPENITISLLKNNPNPAVKFKPESPNSIELLKTCIRDLIIFSSGYSPYGRLEEQRNHLRTWLLINFQDHYQKNQGAEYITAIALLTRKILDKETSLPPNKKNEIYNYLLESFFLFSATQEANPNPRLMPMLEQMDNEQADSGNLGNNIFELIQKQKIEAQSLRIKRNEKIADDFAAAGEGTRLMSIGLNHVDDDQCGRDKNLIKLLEDRGFAVILATEPQSN